MRNFYLEAQLKEAAVAAGALEQSLPDWELDVQVLRVRKAADIEAWIEQTKKDYPHRFTMSETENHQLYADAFGPTPNYSKQAEVVRLVGEDRARQIAEEFGTALGSTKPGKVPEHIKPKAPADPKTNPWSNHRDNVDSNGRFNAKAITRQANTVKGVGETAAAGIAAAVGCKLGDTRPRRAA